jgi:methylmalonyl-CoA mutase
MQKELHLTNDFQPHTYEQWCETVENQLKGAPFAKLVKKTIEGIDISPMYFQNDLNNLPLKNAFPGFSPYIRGVSPTGSVCRSWLVAQEIVYPDPFVCNEALKNDLKRGQTAINIPLDWASKNALDPDQESVVGVGAGGLSVATYDDWKMALNNVPIDQIPIFVQGGDSGIANTAMLIAYAKSCNYQLSNISGWIGIDPIGMLAQTGSLTASLPIIYDEMAELTRWAHANTPKLKTIAVSGIPYHNSGGTAVCETAFIIATAVEYIKAMLSRGLSIDTICQSMVLQFAIGSDFFMEIAKLRAARLLWEKIVTAFGGNENSKKMCAHARTSTYNKTKTDPYVNMLRVTTEALSAICAGCDSLHVEPFDSLLGLPSAFSRRIARNVQIVLRDESHFKHPVDPAGGSWYVENLTAQLAQKIWEQFLRIEKNGGMQASLEKEQVQTHLQAKADERLKNISSRKTVFVGTNKYPNLTEKSPKVNVPDMKAVAKSRFIKVGQFKQSRDNEKLSVSLEKLQAFRKDSESGWFEYAIQAAALGASLAEITKAMRDKTSLSVQVKPLNLHRMAEPFEKLRYRTQEYAQKTGNTPSVFLANMGPIPQHKARADFSTSFFQLAAFDILENKGFVSVDDAISEFKNTNAQIVVICSTDDTYPDLVPELTRQIKAISTNNIVIVAGYPKDHIEAFKEAGVDDFIHLKSNALAFLENLQQQMGVIS